MKMELTISSIRASSLGKSFIALQFPYKYNPLFRNILTVIVNIIKVCLLDKWVLRISQIEGRTPPLRLAADFILTVLPYFILSLSLP